MTPWERRAAQSAAEPEAQPESGPAPWEKRRDEPKASADPARPDHLSAGDALKVGTRAVAHGVADLVGGTLVDLPTAAINLGLKGVNTGAGRNVVPEIRDPFGGSASLMRGYDAVAKKLGFKAPEYESLPTRNKVAYNIPRFAGMFTAGGALGVARAAKAGAELTPSVGSTILDGIVQKRSATLAPVFGDAGAAAGMGAAQTAVDEMRPGANGSFLGKLTEALAPMAGGIAGAGVASAGRAGVASAARGVGDMVLSDPSLPINPATGQSLPRRVVDRAARDLQGSAINPSQAADDLVATRRDLEGRGVDVLPASGLMTGDTGVVGRMETLARSGEGNAGARLVQRGREVATDSRDRFDTIAPDGNPNAPRLFADERAVDMRNAAGRTVDDVQARAAALAEQEAAAGGALAPYDLARRTTANATLDREVVDNGLRPAVEMKNKLFDAAAKSETPVSVEPLRQAAARVRSSVEKLPEAFQSEGLPSTALAGVDQLDGTMPLGAAVAMRPILSAQEATARQAGNMPRTDNIRSLKSGLSDIVDRAAADREPLAAAALDHYREDFAPVWSRGSGDEAQRFRKDFNKDPNSRSETPPSETANRFLATPETAQALVRILNSTKDPQVGFQAGRDYLLASMATGGVLDVKSGRLNLTNLRSWLRQYGDVATAIPGLREELDGIARQATERQGQARRLETELDSAVQQQRLTEETISNGVLGTMLGRDPSHLVQDLLSSKDPRHSFREVVAALKESPQAMRGLSRAIADHLADTTAGPNVQATLNQKRPIVPEKLETVMARFGDALAEALTPGEMNKLRATQAQLRPGMNLGGATAREEGGGLLTKLADAAAQTQLGPIKSGIFTRAGKALTRFLPEGTGAKADRLAVDALIDQPDTLGQLLLRPLPPRESKANWRANALSGAAIGAQNFNR